MSALAPCPICNGTARQFPGHWHDGDWIWPCIVCQTRDCGLTYQPAIYPDKGEMLDRWNAQSNVAGTIKMLRDVTNTLDWMIEAWVHGHPLSDEEGRRATSILMEAQSFISLPTDAGPTRAETIEECGND